MARPTRTNAEYFYHPASFRNDRRVKAIRARLGLAGYGLLLMLLEVLTDADNTQLDTDDIEMELLAGDLGVDVAEIETLLQLAEKVGLFARTAAGLLHCPQLDEWLAPVFEKRNRSRNNALAAKADVSATDTGVSVTEIPPVENSTVENSREEESPPKKNAGAGVSFSSSPAGSQKEITAPNPVAAPPSPVVSPCLTPGTDASKALGAELAGYWHIRETKDARHWAQFQTFTRTMAAAGRLEEVREQFTAYKAFRDLRGFTRHSVRNILGSEGVGYSDSELLHSGCWLAKLAEEQGKPKLKPAFGPAEAPAHASVSPTKKSSWR